MTTNTPPKPNDHLILAILTTVMCCLPLGIVAIVRSSQVNSYWAAGQYEEAENASAEAKKWSLVGMGLFAAGILLYLLLIAIFAIIGISLGEL